MTHSSTRNLLGGVAFLMTFCLLAAEPDLKEYRTVASAVAAKMKPSAATRSGQTGYLGVSVGARHGPGRRRGSAAGLTGGEGRFAEG